MRISMKRKRLMKTRKKWMSESMITMAVEKLAASANTRKFLLRISSMKRLKLIQVMKRRKKKGKTQGKISEAGKEIVASVMQDLTVASQGSSEPEARWFELFSSRYRKVLESLLMLQQVLWLVHQIFLGQCHHLIGDHFILSFNDYVFFKNIQHYPSCSKYQDKAYKEKDLLLSLREKLLEEFSPDDTCKIGS
ncbi:uncharacterized protein LOC131631212 [Vicia villosa]|uniref:uncharacterized protein LOC131631212 n=1 Tax=Vicia villosa TaxID=3911 RepID=UPI00273A9DDE|nr:uncharacterized protein LOC131631212 [Vicia villosa]